MNTKLYFLLFISLALLSCFNSAKKEVTLYDDKVSLVSNLNSRNFNSQVTANRSKNLISIVHYYTLSDGKSQDYVTGFDKLSTDFDGMFKVAAMNCAQYKEVCEKQEITTFPTFKIYPLLPAPVMDYEGKIEPMAIVGYLGKFIPNKVTELNPNNYENFLRERPNLPKAILFSDKKGVPLIFKAVALSFDKKLDFAIVRSSDTPITMKYNIKTFPRVMVIGVGAKKPVFYDGENKYKLVFDFMNVYSETFFKVGEDKTKASETTKADKPWLSERFPELTNESADEVCFKVDGVVCVLLINKEKPDDKLIELFSELQNYLSPKINRGLKYKFGWLNSALQIKYMAAVDLPVGTGPSMMLVNPGKRKRFHLLGGDLNEENMRNIFDKLASGDVRFKNFKGNNIPELEKKE